MSQPSIQRQLMTRVIGAMGFGAIALMLAAYWLTLGEIDEVLDDSLRQTALLLADHDLSGALNAQASAGTVAYGDTESMLVAVARRRDGTLLFTSQPGLSLQLQATPGASVQQANGTSWHVFTVVQAERVVQVAQPAAARHEVAAESASQLLVPLLALFSMIVALLLVALRRGLKPLGEVNTALNLRSETSLAPLALGRTPLELQPLVRTINDLLQRLSTAFEAQRHLVADAAHELRSPVTALQLQVQLLEQTADPLEQAAATRELSAGIGRMRHLIEQLLDLSRVVADRDTHPPRAFERIHLGEIASAAVVRWSTRAEQRRIDLGAKVTAAADVNADPLELEILLNNLLDNALRHTPPGGVVDVAVDTLDGAPVLRVIDSGPGLPETDRERLFDRFFRGPQRAEDTTGSGLGLAIVKAIADRHHAAVWLQPGPDGLGTEARVVFSAAA